MTQKEFAELSDAMYMSMAADISRQITIRSYDERGGSHDDTRPTTKVESDIIYAIAYSAFISYGHRENANADSILDMAEFMMHRFIPEANGYDTIYIPLKKAMRLW